MEGPYIKEEGGVIYVTDPVTGAVMQQAPVQQGMTIQPVTQTAQPAANQTGTIGGIDVTFTPTGAAIPAIPAAEEPADTGGTSGYSGGYRSSGRSSGRSYGGSSYDDYQPRDPAYANGTYHDQYGGLGSLPGLGDRIRAANGQPPGGDEFRPTIYSPSGAGAGPFGASSPDAAWTPLQRRAFDSSGRPAGGGGGNTSAAYQALRAKGDAMAAKVRGMASGIGSGGSSSYGSSSYGSSSYDTPKVKEPRMRGMAKGMDPTQAASLSLHPTFLLPKIFPGLSGASPLYQSLAELPAAQLGMLTKGNWDGGPSDTVNAIGDVYTKIGKRNWFPSADKMLGNLQHPGSGIEEMFGGVKAGKGDSESYTAPGYVYGQEPLNASYAADQYGALLDAALLPLPTETAAKYGSQGYGGFLVDKWGSRALNKKPGAGKDIYKYVGKRLMR